MRVLENLTIDFSMVRNAIIRSLAEPFAVPTVGSSKKVTTLAEYGTDLTRKAS